MTRGRVLGVWSLVTVAPGSQRGWCPLSWEPWGTEQSGWCPGQRGPALLAFPAGRAARPKPGGGEVTPEALPAPPTREATRARTTCLLDSTPHFAKQPRSRLQEGHPSALSAGHRPPGSTGCPASPSRHEPGLRSGAFPRDADGQRGAVGPRGTRPSSECVPWAAATASKAQSPACLRHSPHSSSGFLRLPQGTACGLSPLRTPERRGAAGRHPPTPAPGSPDRGLRRRSPELPKRLHLRPTRHIRRLLVSREPGSSDSHCLCPVGRPWLPGSGHTAVSTALPAAREEQSGLFPPTHVTCCICF